jgi:hypothetical protein
MFKWVQYLYNKEKYSMPKPEKTKISIKLQVHGLGWTLVAG